MANTDAIAIIYLARADVSQTVAEWLAERNALTEDLVGKVRTVRASRARAGTARKSGKDCWAWV